MARAAARPRPGSVRRIRIALGDAPAMGVGIRRGVLALLCPPRGPQTPGWRPGRGPDSLCGRPCAPAAAEAGGRHHVACWMASTARCVTSTTVAVAMAEVAIRHPRDRSCVCERAQLRLARYWLGRASVGSARPAESPSGQPAAAHDCHHRFGTVPSPPSRTSCQLPSGDRAAGPVPRLGVHRLRLASRKSGPALD